MKRLFSFCMITCSSIFNLYGQGGLEQLATAATIRTDLEKLQTNLDREAKIRIKSQDKKLSGEKGKQLRTLTDTSRVFIQDQIAAQKPEYLKQIFPIFAAFIKTLEAHSFYTNKPLYEQDQQLLKLVNTALTTVVFLEPVDLSQSIICKGAYQQATSVCDALGKQEATLTAQLAQIQEQKKKAELQKEVAGKQLNFKHQQKIGIIERNNKKIEALRKELEEQEKANAQLTQDNDDISQMLGGFVDLSIVGK